MTPPRYPEARIPVRPALSAASFLPHQHTVAASVLDIPHQCLVTSGRVALALALRELKVGAGDEVLAPAFHCISMIEPITSLGARPVFYRINADTSCDLGDIERCMSARCRALIATHYFGFMHDMRALREFCDANGIALIEDCAHCLFGEAGGQAVGAAGDFAIASLRKFFPIHDGGCLLSRARSLSHIELRSPGFAFAAKAAVNALEYALQYHRLGAAGRLLRLPLAIKDQLRTQAKAARPRAAAISPDSLDGGQELDLDWIDKRISFSSRYIIAASSMRRIFDRRRSHYRVLLNFLGELRGAAPLFSVLPDGIAPYVFPLRVDCPETVFPALKRQGVPIVRFGEYLSPLMAPRRCPVSDDFSRRLLQFPCHQELSTEEVHWMTQRIKDALGENP